ncbi:hypothetical protein [Helicobacter pylori]|uniref:hypothetical protein n=1 Tax=Helicobacter pylori TaxID=210 RepID=UPI0015E70324|nr:hypothetical protein [Helicobacter pylori]
MMRSLKNKGAFEKRFTPQQGGTSHAEKIKSIKRIIATDFKNFYQGVFYGFSKRK